MGDLKKIVSQNPAYPPVLFFYQGTVEDGRDFFNRFWEGARAVSDKDQYFYRAFGLTQGGLGQTLSPTVVACGLRATLKGYTNGRLVGDVWMMPGAFLVEGARIVWTHHYEHIGDHPDFQAIAEQLGG